jgi:hypothetical protein
MDEDEAFYEESHGPQVQADFAHFDEGPAGPPPISSNEVARLTIDFVVDIML